MRLTISEAACREVLARLLQLNHERYVEEVRQTLHEKKGKQGGKGKRGTHKKTGTKKKVDVRQMSLF